jgi:uncharacterized GH25 family protein
MRGSVYGYVLRAGSGEPIAGTAVVGSRSGRPSPSDDAWSDGPQLEPDSVALTDGAGQFAFDDLQEGYWSFWTHGAPGENVAEATVPVFDDTLTEVKFEVSGSSIGAQQYPAARPTGRKEPDVLGSVRGRVVRADSGDPLGDATITVVRGAGPAPDIAPLTDDAGRFVFDGLPAGQWLLRALGPEGETGEATVRVSANSAANVTIEVANTGEWAVPERE